MTFTSLTVSVFYSLMVSVVLFVKFLSLYVSSLAHSLYSSLLFFSALFPFSSHLAECSSFSFIKAVSHYDFVSQHKIGCYQALGDE